MSKIDKKEDKNFFTEEEYEKFFELSVWAYCVHVERVIRKFTTDDWIREPFIPDL